MSDERQASEAKQLLIVDHDVKLNGDAYKKLSDAGFIVVRGNPASFKIVDVIGVGARDVITDAALATLRVDFQVAYGKDVRARFARELLDRLSSSPLAPTQEGA